MGELPARPAPPSEERIPLADSGFLMWPQFVLRSTGFPFADLTAAVSVEGETDWVAARALTVRRAVQLAASERVRTALLWQNPAIVTLAVDFLHASVADSPRNQRRRASEHTVVKYLQRYHTRNESVGFFGPVCWGTVAADVDRIAVRPGPAVTGRSQVYFEDWAIDAVGCAVAAAPEIAAQLPPTLAAGVSRTGRALRRPEGGVVRLTPAQLEVVRRMDGVRTVAAIAAQLGVPDREVEEALGRLVADGLVRRGFDIPYDLRSERVLAAQLRALQPGAAVRRALDVLGEMEDARARVAAAGSADELTAAITKLDGVFTAVSGGDATRRAGDVPFGRRLLVAQAERDVSVLLGRRLVDELAGPLSLVLCGARWLARRAGEEFDALARAAYQGLAPLFPAGAVPLDALCARLVPAIRQPDWLDPLAAQFQRRWVDLLRPDFDRPSTVRTAGELADPVARAFAGPAPGFHAGRHHSPDVMIAASGPEAVAAGDYFLVLGELHAAMITVDGQSFLDFAPDSGVVPRLVAAATLAHQPRFVPLHGRSVHTATSGWDYPPPDAYSPQYTYLSFGERIGERRVPGWVPASAITLGEGTDGLVARLPSGAVHPAQNVLGEFISYALANRFRILPATPHTPRVTIDRLVVTRESWRLDGDLAPAAALPAPDGYAAVRRLAAERGIPRHSYWRLGGAKPVYLDLHSPLLVEVLLREVRRHAPAGVELTVTEMLPGPDQLWLPDAQGRRYTSELRVVVADTAQPESPSEAPL